MDFIKDYLTYTECQEVPTVFQLWCAMSALSAAAQRKIWLSFAQITICPNLYVVLDGPPGCGKSVAMNIVRDKLLSNIHSIKTKSDSITKEKIYESMEEARDQFTFTDGKTKVLLHSSLTIFANEMSVLIKKGDKDFVGSLNSLFDSLGVFKHSTKNRGETVIINPYLNILGGTTPDWLSANIHEDVMEGGLSARTILVFADKPSRRNPFPALSPEAEMAYARILQRLEQITIIGGPFELTAAFRKYYEIWYNEHYNTPCRNSKMAGFYNRKRMHLLKCCMLLSLARKDSLALNEEDLECGLTLINETEPLIEQALRGVGRNILSSHTQNVMELILEKGDVGIDLADLIRLTVGDINQTELKEILEVLVKMRMITMESDYTNQPARVTVRRLKPEEKQK